MLDGQGLQGKVGEHGPGAKKGVHGARGAGNGGVYGEMSQMLVSTQGNNEASAHGKLSKENGREVDGYRESGGCPKTIETISGQGGRERNQTSKVEPEETQMDMTTTSTSSSSSGDAAPAPSLSSSGAHTLKPVSPEEDDVCNEAGNKRKTDGEHPEEPLRTDNGWGLKEGRPSIT